MKYMFDWVQRKKDRCIIYLQKWVKHITCFFLRAETDDDRKLQREYPQPTPKRNTMRICMYSRPMCQSHLRDGIEQTRNDAVGLGRAEIVLLGEGCDDFGLRNDVVLADGGTGGEGGGGGGGAHGATWSRRAGAGGRGGGGAGSGKAEHGFGSISIKNVILNKRARRACGEKIGRPTFSSHFSFFC